MVIDEFAKKRDWIRPEKKWINKIRIKYNTSPINNYYWLKLILLII